MQPLVRTVSIMIFFVHSISSVTFLRYSLYLSRICCFILSVIHSPDDDSTGGVSLTTVFSIKTPINILCNHCPDDDAMGGAESILIAAVTKDCAGLCKKDADAELEVNFCNKIRGAQGSRYLNSAKSCAIKFHTQADNNSSKNVASNTLNNVATIDSTLILKGVTGDATSKNIFGWNFRS